MEEFVNNIQGIYGLGFIKRLQGPAWELDDIKLWSVRQYSTVTLLDWTDPENNTTLRIMGIVVNSIKGYSLFLVIPHLI